ncbi:MAG: hypothetical protein AMS17_07185 [Spirochaetes bacterium DG_61]|nr:MAG: hypothetical protein AMS17_07185 [Spirochaetes bacterium DG_61]
MGGAFPMKKYIPILFLLTAIFIFLHCGYGPGGPDTPGDADPLLYLEPQYLDFGYSTESLLFNIKNVGSGTLYWTIMEDYNWIDCSETEGESTGEIIPVTVSVDRSVSKLTPENHGFINVYWNKGIEQVEVLVLVSIDDQIFGEVYYVSNSEEFPVVGAVVKVYGVEQCLTDENGEFVLDYTDGEIDLSVEHSGFETYSYNGKTPEGVWRIQLLPL